MFATQDLVAAIREAHVVKDDGRPVCGMEMTSFGGALWHQASAFLSLSRFSRMVEK